MILISAEAMRLSIGSTLRSYKQILVMFNIDVDNMPLPDKSDCGRVILAGGFKIHRSYVVQKKIGKLPALKVQQIFEVKLKLNNILHMYLHTYNLIISKIHENI